MCYTEEMTDAPSPKPWQQQPNDPPKWYDRFHTYLTLGPTRTLTSAFHMWANNSGSPSGTVSKQAAKWLWKERTMAYDTANRQE